jgi:TetR/AcrR family transcriptional regulator, acrAB operon repressor
MPTRRADTSQESRQLLIDAAAALFAQRGYKQTTVADIADRAGISRGSIPWHFGSKDGLLIAVIERAAEELRTALPACMSGRSTHEFFAEISEILRTTSANALLAILIEAINPSSPIHERYCEFHERARTVIADWARTLPRRPGGLPPEDIAVVVVGASIGFQAQWQLAPDRVDIARAFSSLAQLLGPSPDQGGA